MSIKKTYWENRSSSWLKGRCVWEPPPEAFIKYIEDNIPKDNVLLDIGVGSGRYLDIFKNYKYIFGIDFIEKFIINANNLKPTNCTLYLDDVVNLKFNEKVDTIFTMTALQHVHPSQISVAVSNIATLGGKNIILWECLDDWDPKGCAYMWNHNLIELFKKQGYSLVCDHLQPNNVTHLVHLIKN